MNRYSDKNLNELLQRGILAKLAYFHVFKHPLSLGELLSYCSFSNSTSTELQTALTVLINKGLVLEQDGYFFLKTDQDILERRYQANFRAKKRMKIASRRARNIIHCPFVDGVFISGSFSKGVLYEGDDIDFFIITQPGRLWIARVLLTLFKRIFLLNSYKNFCLNYFVDNEHLTIDEKNLYTATEIALILPMYNDELYLRFLAQNEWYKEYYPSLGRMHSAKSPPKKILAKGIERLARGKLGDRLDNYLLKQSRSYLARKYKHLTSEQLAQDLMSTKEVSRHHPEGQQIRIREDYQRIYFNLLKQLDQNG